MSKFLEQRIQKFRFHEIYQPELQPLIKSNVEVDYFPNGNELFLQEMVNIIKQYIKNKVQYA